MLECLDSIDWPLSRRLKIADCDPHVLLDGCALEMLMHCRGGRGRGCWEREVREYHTTSRDAVAKQHQTMCPDVRLFCPPNVRAHLLTSGTTLTMYDRMRDDVCSVISGRASMAAHLETSQPSKLIDQLMERTSETARRAKSKVKAI